ELTGAPPDFAPHLMLSSPVWVLRHHFRGDETGHAVAKELELLGGRRHRSAYGEIARDGLAGGQTDPFCHQGRAGATLDLDGVHRGHEIVAFLALFDVLEDYVVAEAGIDRDGRDEAHLVQAIVQVITDAAVAMLESERPTEETQHRQDLEAE